MPEPSREAREAAEALFHHKHDIPYSEGNARQVARALDQFAEKWREEAEMWKRSAESQHGSVQEVAQERDALRRQIRDAIIAINADTVTDLTHAQDGTLRMAMQAHANGVAALLRRVGELEAEVSAMKGVKTTDAWHWKARAERAEKALSLILDRNEKGTE